MIQVNWYVWLFGEGRLFSSYSFLQSQPFPTITQPLIISLRTLQSEQRHVKAPFFDICYEIQSGSSLNMQIILIYICRPGFWYGYQSHKRLDLTKKIFIVSEHILLVTLIICFLPWLTLLVGSSLLSKPSLLVREAMLWQGFIGK